MEETLEKLREWIRRNEQALSKSLLNGLPGEKINSATKLILPYRLPKALFQLYQVYGGQVDDGIDFVPEFSLLSLEDAVARYMAHKKLVIGSPAWFPVCGFQDGELFVTCSKEKSSESVVYLRHYDGARVFRWHDSIEKFIVCTLECYEKGIYNRGAEGALLVDPDEENRIRCSHSKLVATKIDDSFSVNGTTVFSSILSKDWPESWCAGLGARKVDTDSLLRVSDLSVGFRQGCAVSGEVVKVIGFDSEVMIRLDDQTGSVAISVKGKLVQKVKIGAILDIEIEESGSSLVDNFKEKYGGILGRAIKLASLGRKTLPQLYKAKNIHVIRS